MDAPTLHIGHHFWGAGNIGDDFMLAGFLHVWERDGRRFRLTCCVPDPYRPSQERRFPQIHWLPYTATARAEAIRASVAWLGLGGSPFQSDSGNWFLQHLAEEAVWCRQFDRPMYFLGVGVNDREALAQPECRTVLNQSIHIWTRDDQSATLLGGVIPPARVTPGADLAHIFLRERPLAPPRTGTLGLILHFENRAAFDIDAIGTLLNRSRAAGWSPRWLVQDFRRLDFFEQTVHDLLPREQARELSIFVADYQHDSVEDLLFRWPTPEALVTSRYHGGIVGAWSGCRVVTVERNAKLAGLADQLGVQSTLKNLLAPEATWTAIEASTVPSRERLEQLAVQATESCRQFLGQWPRGRFHAVARRVRVATRNALQSIVGASRP